jgi:hypothetical protein
MTDTTNQSVQSAEDGAQPHTVDKAVEAAEAVEAQEANPTINVEDTSIDDLVKMDPEKLKALLEDKKEAAPEGEAADTVPAGADTQEGGEPHGDTKVTMIPKPRFDEVLSDRNKLADKVAILEKEKAFLSGVAVGAKVPGTPDTAPATDPLKEVDKKLRELDTSVQATILSLTEAFDKGDITLTEFKKREFDANRNAKTIQHGLKNRRDRILSDRNKPSPEQQLQDIESDPDLIEATKGLIQANPWFANVPDENYEELAQLAQMRLVKQGIPIGNDAETQWNIRWTMASIGQQLGYDKVYGGGGNPPSAKPSGTPPAQKPGYTPTPEQKAAKRDLDRNTPPPPNLGGASHPVKIDTADLDLDTMSVDDLSKLPAATLQRMAEKPAASG